MNTDKKKVTIKRVKVTLSEEMFLTGFNLDHSFDIHPNLNFDNNGKNNQ